MALDDVIALDKTSGRGGRGGRGGGGAGGRGRMNAGPRGGGRGGAGGSFRGRGNDQKIVYVTREVPVGRRGGSTGPVRNQRTHYPMGFNPYFGHDDRGEVDDYEVAAPLALTTSRPKQLTTGSKVFVSNLNPDVSVEDLEDLFTKYGGPIKKAVVHYDKNGTSIGSGEIVFLSSADAAKAVQTLNGVPLDSRPLQLHIVGGAK